MALVVTKETFYIKYYIIICISHYPLPGVWSYTHLELMKRCYTVSKLVPIMVRAVGSNFSVIRPTSCRAVCIDFKVMSGHKCK